MPGNSEAAEAEIFRADGRMCHEARFEWPGKDARDWHFFCFVFG